MPGIDLGLGLLNKRSRRRVVRVQRGGLRLKPLEVASDLGQCLGQLVVGKARVLADDLQQRLSRVLGHAERLADVCDAVEQRAGRALHCRFGHLLKFIRRQPEIAG